MANQVIKGKLSPAAAISRLAGRREHRAVFEVLPWYVNESLLGRERAMVLKHLASCEVCQTERDRLYGLQDLISENADDAADASMSFRRVMQRIDSSEKNRESLQEVADHFIEPRRIWMPAALVATLVLTVGLITSTPRSPDSAEFQTLTSDSVTLSEQTRRVELGFVQPIPATTLRRALIETRSTIVSGPDESGRYLVEVTVPDTDSAENFLTGIKQIEGVEFARFAQR